MLFINYVQLDELGEAENALSEANMLCNTDPEVWGYLTLVCLRQKRVFEAEQSYKYAIKVQYRREALYCHSCSVTFNLVNLLYPFHVYLLHNHICLILQFKFY